MDLVIKCYCRKSEEEFDDEAIPEKTEMFKKLTMDVVWEFGFFLTQQNLKLVKLSNTYFLNKERAK